MSRPIKVGSSADWQGLERLGVLVLEQADDWALLLVDDAQLEELARLRFEPHATNALDTLVAAHARRHSGLASSLQPLLEEAEAVAARPKNEPNVRALTSLRAAIHETTPEQRASLAMLTNVDDDGDGLTNTQEEWWCTDATDEDSDDDGVSDRDEVQALKDWLGNSHSAPPIASGKPFSSWPSSITGCRDDDGDDVPDLAERWELGLNMNLSSTDRDRYGDGIELYGADHTGAMSPIVRTPGNHPFVAAYPVINVDAVPSSFNVETVTELYFETTVITGTAKTYGTSETRGVSDSVADTVTWNDWQEVSVTTQLDALRGNIHPQFNRPQRKIFNDDPFGDLGPVVETGWELLVKGCDEYTIEIPVTVTCGGSTLSNFGRALHWYVTSPLTHAPRPDFGSNKVGGDSAKSKAEGLHGPFPHEIIRDNEPAMSSQDRVSSVGGTRYEYSPQSQAWSSSQSYPVVYPAPAFVPTTTASQGASHGGAHTVTHTEYQEHTVSQSQQFSTQRGWTEGWAKNTAHVADLTFTYRVSNVGTDYARSLSNMIFNVYLGRDPNPAFTCQMHNPPPDRNCNLVSLENVFPGDEHTYTSGRIALSFEQLAALDLGGPIYVVLDSYSLGEDDVFFQNARQGGVTVLMDDGVEDGDESLDVYVLPTWEGDRVLDVMARYFPDRRDAEGNLLALSTPEFGSNSVSWMARPLSDANWFNLYLDNLGDGSEPFRDTMAQSNSTILMRYQSDSDRDGYSDRSEMRVLCGGQLPCAAVDDAAIHPEPGLVAGLNTSREGDDVTGRLTFLNTGNYDAYGVEAIMYAPDPSVSIGNNTIGGGGRVKAASQVVLGSRIRSPILEAWRNSSARPYSAGSYTGNTDKVFTFAAQDTGAVGSSQPITFDWSDGSNSGRLTIPAGYQSPLPLVVSQGVEVGFYSGSIIAGDVFTVGVELPRDTFIYTIESEPFTPPSVVVSYNDPQGNHRFISPLELDDLGSDLAPHRHEMLDPLSLEIATTAPFTPTGDNTTHYVFNLPDSRPIVDGHLFVEYIKDDGTVVAEQVLTQTYQAGPNIIPVTWSTSLFTETYNADHDYNILALVTDWQGNIIQSLARPLSSFQQDPLPVSATDTSNLTWDFGRATQGELLNHTLTLANTGFATLLTHVNAPAELTISQANTSQLAPADNNSVAISLDTTGLPTGAYSQTLTLRTSDPDNPTYAIQVVGTITDDAPVARAVPYRPLDLRVTIPVDHEQGEWITYTHTVGPEPENFHPVKVYSQDRETELGIGKYATDFGNGTYSTSKVFRDLQTIPTEGASDWESFTIDNEHYLAVANNYNNSTSNVNSKIYRWNGSNFEEFQSIPTNGALDWEFFSIGSQSYLAVANSSNSKIYRWNGTSFEEFQSIATNGARNWEFFSIGSQSYLAVANYSNNSKIYRWNGTSFEEFQSIATNGAWDWQFFTIGDDHYLAVANYLYNSTRNINSKIYRWNGSSFEEFQSIATNGARDWQFFTIGDDYYLVVANSHNNSTANINSKIYRWNGSSFEEFQSIPTIWAWDWEFFTIGREHYLAVTSYNDTNYILGGTSRYYTYSKIYRWNGTSFEEFQSIPTIGAVDWKFFTIGSNKYIVVANHQYHDTIYNINSTI